jgi:hypothetical protein
MIERFRLSKLAWLALVLSSGLALAQDPAPEVRPVDGTGVTEERVRATVGWLAADERRGRDTGSPELAAAAEWIAERFAAARLQQVREGSWTHEFGLPGVRLDSTGIAVELTRKLGGETQKFVLAPDADVRWWLPGDALAGAQEECTVALADDPVLQRLLMASAARRPILIEVEDTHAYWRAAKGAHPVIARRRQASRPVFLVRKGILPEAPARDREAVWSATWSTPASEVTEVPQHNVVALLPGTVKKDEYVVVSAHYDHVGVGREVDGDGIYNGADDNATGTTAVILLAEAMARLPAPRRSVLFVAFAAEERGLLGSAAFCERPPVPLERIVANLNIEMIGRPEEGRVGKAWITGAEYSDFAAIVGDALAKGGVELVEFGMASRLFSASDNHSFVRKGIVAHSLSAGSLHADYHQPGDEVDKLDIVHMTTIIRAMLHAVRDLADRDEAPRWNERGEEMLKRRRR